MKRLQSIGNSLGVIIEKPILELLKIGRETDLEITTDGERLIIAPVRKPRRQRVEEAMTGIMKRHGSTFRKLAK